MVKLVPVVLFLFFFFNAPAQLCTGSLGDPIVNITFGAGSNPGGALPVTATGYTYTTADCPEDGSYTIRSFTNGCFGSTWHTLSNDHTGNTNGYFMVVNSAYQPSAFYIDTVKNLCGNTTYEFASWVINLLKPDACSGAGIQPNLTFTIEKTDGTVLQTYNSGNIASSNTPQWRQFGFFFTTPVTADIVIRIVNNAPGGCGNDLALDDITFRPCGPLLVPSITNEPATTTAFCQGPAASYTFSCQVSGGITNPYYQWQQKTNNVWTDIPGANALSYTASFPAGTAPGTYAFRFTASEQSNAGSPQCRINSDPVTVVINANPVTTASNNGPVCAGKDVSFSATGGTIYDWTGPNGFATSGAAVVITNAQQTDAGKYYVLVKNAAGCPHLDSSILVVNPVPMATTADVQVSICEADSVLLSASGGNTYEWQPAAGLSSATVPAPKASPAASTDYAVIVSNSFGCTDTAYTKVIVSQKPRVNAGEDKVTFTGTPVQINGTVSGDNIQYFWDASPFLSNALSLEPLADPSADTKFVLNAVSLSGCGKATDTMEVFVYNALYIPNAFTPNGDGINDTWNLPALRAFNNFELSVFNRYGETVFHLNNNVLPWDGTYKGKKLPLGVYVYVIDFKGKRKTVKGTVSILR